MDILKYPIKKCRAITNGRMMLLAVLLLILSHSWSIGQDKAIIFPLPQEIEKI
jgi:hypothetical protein